MDIAHFLFGVFGELLYVLSAILFLGLRFLACFDFAFSLCFCCQEMLLLYFSSWLQRKHTKTTNFCFCVFFFGVYLRRFLSS